MPKLNMTLADPQVVQNPYPYYARLREEDPLHFDERIQTWLVTRYKDIVEAAHNTEVFSDEMKIAEAARSPLQGEIDNYLKQQGYELRLEDSLKVDGELHRRRRSLVAHAFSAPVVAGLIDRVSAICRNRIESFAGKDVIDLVADYAKPVPVEVITDTLGLPPACQSIIEKAADSMASHLGQNVSREQAYANADNMLDLVRFARETIEEKRKNPGKDLISELVNIPTDDPRVTQLTASELLMMVTTSISGGVETTRNGIAYALLALVTQEGLFERIRHSSEQDKDLARLVEEALRFCPPVPALPRVVTKETVLAGKTLPEGALVMLCWASGNRDAEKFDAPDTFDIDRSNVRQHLTFGSGVHHCIGAQLARSEIKCAIREFINTVDSLTLAVPQQSLDYSSSKIILRILSSLPVRITRAKAVV